MTQAQASAGMTVVTLSDMARLRLEALSFFVVAYFGTAWAVKGLWNHLATALPVMPRLDYRKSLALVFLSGLLFYVVLTMISGARELLTPGAWEKQGMGYRERPGAEMELGKVERRRAIERLQREIWRYAAGHEGSAPASPFDPETDIDDWHYPGGGYYGLMPGARPGVGRDILSYEPATAGARRFVLFSDGSIEDMAEGRLKSHIRSQLAR